MREILFRGKLLSDGRWAEGNLDIKKSGVCIITPDETPVGCYGQVDPETVGQYTGLTDKNGKRIFEGDILAFPDTGEDGYEYKEGYDFMNVATVCWNNGRWELEDFGDENSGVMDDMDFNHNDFVAIFPLSEVIGNIYDNPAMIGGVYDGK